MKKIRYVALLLALTSVLLCFTSCSEPAWLSSLLDGNVNKTITGNGSFVTNNKNDDNSEGSNNGSGSGDASDNVTPDNGTADTVASDVRTIGDGLFMGVVPNTSGTASLFVVCSDEPLKSNTTYKLTWSISYAFFFEDYPDCEVLYHDGFPVFWFNYAYGNDDINHFNAYFHSVTEEGLFLQPTDGYRFTTGDIPEGSMFVASLCSIANVDDEANLAICRDLRDNYVMSFKLTEIAS